MRRWDGQVGGGLKMGACMKCFGPAAGGSTSTKEGGLGTDR